MKNIIKHIGYTVLSIGLIVVACEKNHAPDTPAIPDGPSQGIVNTDYEFISSAIDAEDDSVSIRFDWGDGDTSAWSYIVGSGQPVILYHFWFNPGTYEIKAQARDKYLHLSLWSFSTQITISSNFAPASPTNPFGPNIGFVNFYYRFTTITSDPNQDSVAYQFDWGNDDTSSWSIYMPSDTPNYYVSPPFAWRDSGPYLVRARAKDTQGTISGWSYGHQIVIHKSDAPIPNQVITNILVGSNPAGVAALPNGDFVYVANNNDSSVSVIRSSDNTVIATIPVQNEPWALTALPNNNYVYVTNAGSNTVSVIRVSDNTVFATIPVGQTPFGIATLPNSDYVYVANMGSDNVFVIRTLDNTITTIIPVGYSPTSVLALPNGNYIYVANEASNTISVIQTSNNTVVATISIPSPRGLTATPNSDYIYAAHESNQISKIRTFDNTIITTFTVGNDLAELTTMPNGNYTYVTNRMGDNVLVFNTQNHTIVANIPTGINPLGITVLSNGNYLYVANNITNNVSVIGR